MPINHCGSVMLDIMIKMHFLGFKINDHLYATIRSYKSYYRKDIKIDIYTVL
jgi:hypothetical protein